MLGKTLLVCLLFSLSCWAVSAWSAPRLFFSDLESGPNTGGQDNRGAFVTLYGRGFGAERGKARVTIGGGAAATYPIWTDTKITFQLGPAARTGPIIVALPGKGVSSGLPFTVRPGTIYFVSTTGDDSHDGSFHAPWKTLVKAKNAMRPGDITYALDGVTQTTADKYNAALSIETDGTADAPIALVAYPGAKVTIGTEQGLGFGIRIPNTGVTGNYWVMAGLTLRGGEALSLGGNGCTGWRIIGNDLSCPTGRGYGCVTTSRATHVKFFGNNVHDICTNNAATISKLYHAVYFSTDSNHIEVAWNTIRNNQGNRGIQFHSSPIGDNTGYNQYDLLVHDNLIYDCRGDGINFATVDPSKGPVKAYNNVLCHVGTGPDFPEGPSDYAGIYVAGGTNTGSNGQGNVEIYNNTLYDCGSRGGSDAGMLSRGSGSPQLCMLLKNNLVYVLQGETYLTQSSASQQVQGSHNLFFGSGDGPAFLTDNLNADPHCRDFATKDFHLRPDSPARHAGVAVSITSDADGVPRPSGPACAIGAYESE